jgi:2-iminobutanoate/2-iminopropanoate deaminase
MPKKEIISPAALSAAGPPLSPATKFGNTVYVSGQTGRHATTNDLPADVAAQTTNAIERIKLCLEEAGTSLDNVVTATCWLTDPSLFPAFNEVYASYFTADRPARATVGSQLMGPGMLVEIQCIAVIPD